MLKSIYQELLGLSENQMAFNAISFGDMYGYDEDEDEDYDPATQNGVADEDVGEVIGMPLERTFLCIGQDIQVDIEDLHFSILNLNLPEEALKKYVDGELYKQYPIAVSFLMDRQDYIRYTRQLVKEDKAIVSYSGGACHTFEDGIQVLDMTAGPDQVRMIMGFAKEGVFDARLARSSGQAFQET